MRLAALVVAVAVAGCSNDGAQHGGARDLGVPVAPDLATPAMCNPVDNMGDGTPCAAGCAAGTLPVIVAGTCKCWRTCMVDTECACDRKCNGVSSAGGDGGSAGKACLPGNAALTRCGLNPAGGIFGDGFCAQGFECVNADTAQQLRYCMYDCPNSNADCPAQTTCQALFDPKTGNVVGNVCALVSNDGGKAPGDACVVGVDKCRTGSLCDGVCRPQCDGPGGSCASGTCTALTDTAKNKLVGYVCE